MENLIKSLNIALNLGFIIALPAVIFIFLGVFLDKIFQTNSILTIIFIFLGILSGIFSGFKESQKFLIKKK